MFKKSVFGWFLALALALVATVGAFAATSNEGTPPPDPIARPARHIGQVTAVGDNTFTLKLLDGKTVQIAVDDDTRFRKAGGGEASFADITVGRWVAGAVKPPQEGEEGVLHARVVIILPEDFDPARLKNIHRYPGKVSTVGNDSLTIQTRDGQSLTFAVTDQTRFRSRDGAVKGLDDLKPEMPVLVIAKDDNGQLTALAILAGEPDRRGERHIGKVTAVGNDSLTIQTRDGQSLTFAVTDQTRFRSRDGAVKGLDDLKPEMPVLVIAKDDNGQLTALAVFAGEPERRGERHIGKVTAVGNDSLTIQTRDGQSLTFAVTDQTRFRSRDGAVKGLDDLKPEMPVLVIAKDDNGQLTALAVFAGRPPQPGIMPERPGWPGRPGDQPPAAAPRG